MARRKGPNFAGIPRDVMDFESYKSLRGSSVKLLVELAYQFKGKNNGDLSITWKLMKGCFRSSTTLFKARDELLEKGFIVINAYGGKTFDGRKLPHLYALTWETIHDFINPKKNLIRYTHFPINRPALKYYIKGYNPNYKNSIQIKKQFKKDLKRANVVHEQN